MCVRCGPVSGLRESGLWRLPGLRTGAWRLPSLPLLRSSASEQAAAWSTRVTVRVLSHGSRRGIRFPFRFPFVVERADRQAGEGRVDAARFSQPPNINAQRSKHSPRKPLKLSFRLSLLPPSQCSPVPSGRPSLQILFPACVPPGASRGPRCTMLCEAVPHCAIAITATAQCHEAPRWKTGSQMSPSSWTSEKASRTRSCVGAISQDSPAVHQRHPSPDGQCQARPSALGRLPRSARRTCRLLPLHHTSWAASRTSAFIY